jgi:hypothetical protein
MKSLLALLALPLALVFGPLSTCADSTNASTCTADTLVISAAKPLAVEEAELRQAVYKRCKEMLDAPAGQFGAHPSAAAFPGPVAENAPRITRTVKFKHTPPPADKLP